MSCMTCTDGKIDKGLVVQDLGGRVALGYPFPRVLVSCPL